MQPIYLRPASATPPACAYDLLRRMPVALNNLYGDPTVQWANTMAKARRLAQDGHLGPVGILTRGRIDTHQADELAALKPNLPGLLVIVSVSGLPTSIEPVPTAPRYETLRNLTARGVPVMVALRPLIPSLNGTREVLAPILSACAEAGARVVVASGFRGDDDIVQRMVPEEKDQWVLRVKLMTPQLSGLLKGLCQDYGLTLSKRVSCGVALALSLPRSYNPYWTSPQLAGCGTCSLRDQCGFTPVPPGGMELLARLGFDAEFEPGRPSNCNVDPSNRLGCASCCTCCFMLDNPRIVVRNPGMTLGTLGFIRFLTGMTAVQHGIVDGARDAGDVRLPALPLDRPLTTVNSWYVLARSVPKCYGCTYCIVSAYDVQEREYGLFPSELAQLIEDLPHASGKEIRA